MLRNGDTGKEVIPDWRKGILKSGKFLSVTTDTKMTTVKDWDKPLLVSMIAKKPEMQNITKSSNNKQDNDKSTELEPIQEMDIILVKGSSFKNVYEQYKPKDENKGNN